MADYLFVYGTLMAMTSDPRVNRVVRHLCEDAGPASVAGRLYCLGRYPGLVAAYAADRQERVRGRLLRIRAPAQCWPVLDAYEGYRADEPEHSEFVRRRIEVRREPRGQTRQAWVYLYNGPRGRGRPIDSWPPRHPGAGFRLVGVHAPLRSEDKD